LQLELVQPSLPVTMAQNRFSQTDVLSLIQENILLRLVLASGWSALVGVGLFLASLAVPSPWNRLLEIAGTVFLTIGLAHLISDFSLRNSVRRQILAAVGLSSDLDRAGLDHIGRFKTVDWSTFFSENRGDVHVCFRTGHQWTSDNAIMVLEFAAKRGAKVTVTLMDPDGPAALVESHAAAFKTKGGVVGLRQQLRDTIKEWHDSATKVAHDTSKAVDLTVECSQAILPYTFYSSGDAMWLIMSAAQQRRIPWQLPALLCHATSHKDEGIYEWVMRDVDECRDQKLISNCQIPSNQTTPNAASAPSSDGGVKPSDSGEPAPQGGKGA